MQRFRYSGCPILDSGYPDIQLASCFLYDESRAISRRGISKQSPVLGFAPDYWSFHPTTGLSIRQPRLLQVQCAFYLTTYLNHPVSSIGPDTSDAWHRMPRKLENRDFRISENRDFRRSGNPDTRKSGHPDIFAEYRNLYHFGFAHGVNHYDERFRFTGTSHVSKTRIPWSGTLLAYAKDC